MWSLRSVGSLKLQVSFAKETYKRDDILQKRLIILRSLLIVVLIVATPYVWLLPTDTQERVAHAPDTHVCPPRVHTHTCHRMREDRTWVLTWALESKKHK